MGFLTEIAKTTIIEIIDKLRFRVFDKNWKIMAFIFSKINVKHLVFMETLLKFKFAQHELRLN